MKTFETDAIVLTTRDHGESDRLIAFHSASRGKLRGIAKGARKSKKRFVNAFEPCSLVELTCKERNSWVWIETCKLVEPYIPMRADIEKWACAALFSEIVLEMVPEGEPQPELFLLHKETLNSLERDKDPQNVILMALLRFQSLMGYMPALEGCAICRRKLGEARKWYWQAGQGRLVCPDHFSPNERYTTLDPGSLALIHYSRSIALEKIWRLRVNQAMKMPLLRGLVDWFRCQTGKEVKSMRVLEQILPSRAEKISTGRGKAGGETSAGPDCPGNWESDLLRN
ncbi:MAG: DNA repair protein RecO [Desulfobacteraceae bacterium]|nr:DNA repair protein RecO [Desulfobacteraceae bacterium]